ncbi:LAGLIDADG family homing endonuclease [Ornithinimicrobium tianjinense]|uniref:LAGLIDADG family homing endonuclease n=1 Tax=Ornithinimicrobium tianjinense TaxID=1195761 RepID=UPI0035314C43
MPAHRALHSRWAGFEPKPSVQANGTCQLRLTRQDFVDYLSALGVSKVRSADKEIPHAIFTAPEETVTAFLRGLFDADGCVVNDLGKGTRYVGLGSKSEELLRGAQALLGSLDIWGGSIGRGRRRTTSPTCARTAPRRPTLHRALRSTNGSRAGRFASSRRWWGLSSSTRRPSSWTS